MGRLPSVAWWDRFARLAGEDLQQWTEEQPLVDGPRTDLVGPEVGLELRQGARRYVVSVPEHTSEMCAAVVSRRHGVDLQAFVCLQAVLHRAQEPVRGIQSA